MGLRKEEMMQERKIRDSVRIVVTVEVEES